MKRDTFNCFRTTI